VQAIPGNEFVEVTGSSLANEGVPGAQRELKPSSKPVEVYSSWTKHINSLLEITLAGRQY
jgi:hypothetical protein